MIYLELLLIERDLSMRITESRLRRIIRSVLLQERNQPNLLKKSYPYDLLIANLNSEVMSEIYEDFQDDDLVDNFISASTGSADYSYSVANDVEENVAALRSSEFSLLELKKSEEVITHLEDYYEFNFSNCNVRDSKPIFCLAVNKLTGDFTSKLNSPDKFRKKVSNLLKNQIIRELEDWNWAAHDFHHGEVAIETDDDSFLDPSRVSSIGLTDYESPQTGYEYMDKHAESLPHYFQIGIGDKPKVKDYWLTLIGFYFNKIGFTRGVSGNDIWASINSYCLTRMSGPEDAYEMDFTIVNEPGKRNLVVGRGEIKELQKFFANAYKTVHKYSLLSNLKDNRIYIALML